MNNKSVFSYCSIYFVERFGDFLYFGLKVVTEGIRSLFGVWGLVFFGFLWVLVFLVGYF
ncbi:hypothetical protein [Klebsiella pneumoniae]|uniref:hypothetical protein n=1 Tax=Klebsiella pneumoniae TaxID=573 RepID=UPI0034E965B0